jgi:cytochrome d ubiquinol oxidase subunit I
MDFDPVLLARLQFAFTVTFHIIFPSFTIGLSAFIATLLVRWIVTGREHLHRLARFWTKIFAVSFGMGVVSGIVLSYQFGTNWSRFSVVVGNVIAPLIGYEVLTAFFLEATFLGVMLFGWKRVPPWLHVFAAVAVAVGTAMSAFWILSANSWMQTPTGHEVRDGIAYPVDWFGVVFNPSFFYRLPHMLTAAYLTTSLVVLAVGARYVLAARHLDEGRTMMRMAIGMLAVLGPLQLFIGDQHGLNTLAHQPMKIAAVEAHWDGSKPGALVLFAWPDEKTESNLFEIAIPKAGSLILKHDPNGLFPGLKSVPPADRPPLVPVFFAFRSMVGIGVIIIAFGLVGAWLWWRRTVFDARWYLRLAAHSWWLGFDLRLDRDRKRTPTMGRIRHIAYRRCSLAGSRCKRGLDPRLVRARLRGRVHDGHLLHQPADRAGTARPRGRAAGERHAGTAVVRGNRRCARNSIPATITRGKPWKPTFL